MCKDVNTYIRFFTFFGNFTEKKEGFAKSKWDQQQRSRTAIHIHICIHILWRQKEKLYKVATVLFIGIYCLNNLARWLLSDYNLQCKFDIILLEWWPPKMGRKNLFSSRTHTHTHISVHLSFSVSQCGLAIKYLLRTHTYAHRSLLLYAPVKK